MPQSNEGPIMIGRGGSNGAKDYNFYDAFDGVMGSPFASAAMKSNSMSPGLPATTSSSSSSSSSSTMHHHQQMMQQAHMSPLSPHHHANQHHQSHMHTTQHGRIKSSSSSSSSTSSSTNGTPVDYMSGDQRHPLHLGQTKDCAMMPGNGSSNVNSKNNPLVEIPRPMSCSGSKMMLPQGGFLQQQMPLLNPTQPKIEDLSGEMMDESNHGLMPPSPPKDDDDSLSGDDDSILSGSGGGGSSKDGQTGNGGDQGGRGGNGQGGEGSRTTGGSPQYPPDVQIYPWMKRVHSTHCK